MDEEEFDAEITARIQSSMRQRMEHVFEQIAPKETGRSPLPEGTVTIVFTDVVGSTDLVHVLGDERARAVLRDHDRIVRETLEAHKGIEVERVGDSFMAVFRTARKAVEFALDLHDRLAREGTEPPVRVRIGMDTGEVIAEEKGYFGATVVRASRIAAQAGPGQTLASEATKVLAQTGSPATFEGAGPRELKGLPGTHPVFDVKREPASPELPAG
jgi:adenylate cyclase